MRGPSTPAFLLAFALAGCADPPPGTAFVAAGTHGFFAPGWAYDGSGVVQASEGFILVEADNATDTGTVRASTVVDGVHYDLASARFFADPGKGFQDGGIRSGFHEHGLTQAGDSSIPTVYALSAGWGEGTVRLNGTRLVDRTTGSDAFGFHYMAVSTGVRDDAARAIFADATHRGYYDPQKPSVGDAVDGDYEITLVVRSRGVPSEDGAVLKGDDVNHPDYAYTDTFQVDVPYSLLLLDFDLQQRPSLPASAPYELTFRLRDPENSILRERTFRGEAGEFQRVLYPIETYANRTGAYRLDVTGHGAGLRWDLTGPVEAPRPVQLVFWWEDVVFDEAARAYGATAKVTATHPHGTED